MSQQGSDIFVMRMHAASYSQAISETPTLSGYTRYPGVDYKQFYDYAW